LNIESRGHSHSKYIHIYIYRYIYTYIDIEREREREREAGGGGVVYGRSLRYHWQEFSLQDSRATSWRDGDLYVPRRKCSAGGWPLSLSFIFLFCPFHLWRSSLSLGNVPLIRLRLFSIDHAAEVVVCGYILPRFD
jgi:hypothetical protein